MFTSIWLAIKRQNPIKLFPWDKKCILLTRLIFGQLYYILMITAAPLIPLSLVMVCQQTGPFWVSIVALVALGERIIFAEIVAMCLCFTAVIFIAF